jgi:hypothetical protein
MCLEPRQTMGIKDIDHWVIITGDLLNDSASGSSNEP